MPEVGVLNLTIRDNSDDAGKGLDRLAAALSAVKAAKARFDLSTVGQQVTELAKTIQQTKGTSTIIKNLGTMFNAINKFSQLKDFTIDAEKLRDTAMYMNRLADGMARMNEARQASVHGGGAHDMYGQMVEDVKTVKDAIEQTADSVEKNSHRIFNLQIFASRGTKKSPGQIGMDLDGLEKQADLFKETKETVDYATGAVDKFKDTAANLAGPVKAIDLEKYIGSPLESIINKVQMGGTAMERFWDSLAIKFPTVSVEAMEKAVAGNAALAKAEIAGLFKMLEKPIKYKGLGEFIKAKTGITHAAQGSGINENTTMFKPISETIGGTAESVERVQEATSGMVKMFDAVSGAYKEMYVDGNAAVESNNKIAESMERVSSTMQEGISLMNMPASGKNGTFANASEEMQYLTERIEEAKLAQQQFNDIAANAEKQMKYGGPMKSEELEFNLRHATEGFYQAAEAEEVYKAALHDLMTYAAQTAEEMRRATDTAVETPVAQSVENLNAVMNEASNDGLEKFKSEMDEIVNATTPALSKIELLQNKAKFLKDKLARLYEMPATDELGNDTGRNNAINETLLKIGAVNEQIQKMVDKAHEAQEALQFDKMKGEASSQITPWAMTDVDNLVNQYNEIDLLTMKMEGMKQALLDDINQNKLDTQQIAERTIAIQNLKDKIEELKNAQEEASSIHGKLGSAMDSFREGMKKAFPVISGLLKRFKSMMIMRSLRYVIRQIASGLSEGVKNVYYYSQAVGTSFAPAMDAAATSLKQMKNSIGAALAPAIQALIPVLQTVVSWFITLVNYVNQFFALLRGQDTWTRALPQATTAFKDQTKAAKGASDAMKDLLADWDELNIIQSQSGSGGGGSGGVAEDYATMFEEVSEFDETVKGIIDFIKDNMDDVLGLAKTIGATILGWKLSDALLGGVDKLSSIVKIGLIIALSYEATKVIDEAYGETGDAMLLVADAALNGALAAVAGKLANAAFGKGAGSIAAGIVLSVSAGVSFAEALKLKEAEDNAKWKMLALTAAIKAGIAMALVSAGLIKLGAGAALGIAGGVITVALITSITFITEFTAEAMQSAEDTAKAAFSETGAGGINPQDYVDALEKEFKKQTSAAQLVIDAYVNVPDLKDTLQTAATKISEFNQIVFHGDGKLTEEDAKAFSENWNTVLDTLKKMDTSEYNTILEGLSAALTSKNKELREQARELRTTFIMIEKNVSEEDAAIYAKMEELEKKIAGGDRSKEVLDEYDKYYQYLAMSTRTGLTEIEKALKEGTTIDFGDSDTALQSATDFINKITSETQKAIKAEEDAFDAVKESVEDKQRKNEWKYNNGIIDKTEYTNRKAMYDDLLKIAEDYKIEKVKEIQESVGKAYETVLKQALGSENVYDSAYWRYVIVPLVKDMNKSGVKISDSLLEALADGMTSSTYGLSGNGITDKWLQELFGDIQNNENLTVDDIVDTLNTEMEDAIDEAKRKGIVPDYFTEIMDMYNLSGVDVISDDVKANILANAKRYFDTDFVEKLANALGYKGDILELEIPAKVSIKNSSTEADNIAKQIGDVELSGTITIDKDGININANEFADINQLYTKLKGIVLDSGAGPLDQLDYMADLVELFDSKDFDTLLRLYQEIKEVGVDNAFTMYDNYQKGFGWSNGKAPTAMGYRAAGFVTSDVDWSHPNVSAPSTEQPAVTEADIASGVAKGTATGNAEQNELLRQMANYLLRIANKDFSVNINPSTMFARTANASENMYTRVTGG